jgi:hypothetical protein
MDPSDIGGTKGRGESYDESCCFEEFHFHTDYKYDTSGGIFLADT